MKKLLYTFLITIISLSLFAQPKISAPALVSPENNENNQMPDALLDWNAVAGIGQVSYLVQVDETDAFTNPVEYNVNTTSVSTENLFFGKKYFWRVKAFDETGESDWSETYSFTVFERLLLKSPNDESEGENPDVTLSWRNKVGTIPISGFTYVDCQADTMYFWKVDNTVPVTNDLNGMCFLDENTGFIAGDAGTILAWDGNGWSEITSNTSVNLNDIFMFDANTGIAVGENGTVIMAENGTWNELSDIPTTKELNSVYAVDQDNIWIVGKSGTILFGNASGFTAQTSPVTKDLFSVFAFGLNDVWATGKSGKILHYDGTEWAEVDSPVTKSLYNITFVSADNAWIVGASGTILHYDGTEWSEYESEITSNLYDVQFLNENMGIAVGKSGVIANFRDGVWSSSASGSASTLKSLAFVDEDNIWVAGEDGTVVIWNGNNAFNSPAAVTRTTTIDSTQVQMAQLLFGQKYYWRVRARTDYDTSEWSQVRSFSTVDKVSLSFPPDGSQDQMLDLTLQWEEITGSFSYIFEVCRDPNFTVPCLSYTDQTEAQAQALMYDSTYYWRVKAAHNLDTTDWSDVWHFTTINTVYLTSPADGDTVGTLPDLVWEGQSGTEGYLVQYDTTDTFDNPEINIVYEPFTNFQVIFQLTDKQVYYWRVKAFHDGDTTNWSEVRSFFVDKENGVEDILTDKSVTIYPNPVSSELTVSIDTPNNINVTVSISDLLGKEVYSDVYSFNNDNKTKTIDVSSMNNGVYMLQLKVGQTVVNKKLVIDR